MSDEYVCEECAYTTANDEKSCPLCGGRVVSLDDGFEQDSFSEAEDDMNMSMEEDFDLDAESYNGAI